MESTKRTIAIQLTGGMDERGGCRGWLTEEARKEGIELLRKQGFNYFTTYKDTNAEFAVSYAKVPESFYSECLVKNPNHGWMVRHPGYDLMF